MPAEILQNNIVVWAVQDFPTWTEFLARLLSHLGSEYFYLLLLPLLFWFAPWTVGLTAARTVVLTDLVGEWIKWSLTWPRPSIALVQETSPGFVSTHAALSMALGVSVWSRWPRVRPLLAIWVIGVGWSRLRLGVHYPLDIVGGWTLGLIVASVLRSLDSESRRTLFWVGGSALVVVILWPSGGESAWQRDLGLLIGLEFGVTFLLRNGPVQVVPLSLNSGLGRLSILVAAYLGMKLLAWPILLRYCLLGVLVSLRRHDTPSGQEDESVNPRLV